MKWKWKVFGVLFGLLGVCFSISDAYADVPVTSPFGWRIHPIYGGMRFHTGADIGYEGGTEVLAMLPGEVEFADWWSGYGKCVILKHDGGDHTLYGHMDMIDVKKGDTVMRGSVLGTVGQTGVATGPHLHLEYWKNGQYVDPLVLYGMAGSNVSMLPEGAIMPVYTMGSVNGSPTVQSPNISKGIKNQTTANQFWQEPISFVMDSDRRMQEQQGQQGQQQGNSSMNNGVNKSIKNGNSFVEEEKEELHAIDYLRDAARRRRLGKSNPYYSRKNVEERLILDSLVSTVQGKKPYAGAFDDFADKVSEQVADAVVGKKQNQNQSANQQQVNRKNGFNEPAKQQAQPNHGFNL